MQQSIGESTKSPSLPNVEFHPMQLVAWMNMSLEDMSGEVWYDLADYVGLYKISNYFRLKRLERIVLVNNGRQEKQTKKEAIQKQTIYNLLLKHLLKMITRMKMIWFIIKIR